MRSLRKAELYLNLGIVFVIVQINKNFSIYKVLPVLYKNWTTTCPRSQGMSSRKIRDVGSVVFHSHSSDYAVAQQNVVFQDTTAQSYYSEPLQNQDDTFKVHDSTDASLASFLARPVLIASHVWPVGSFLDFDYDPWSLFYDDPKVQKKVDGFYLQRFDLKIKLLINGSPFYYGKCLASYNPLGQQDAIDKLTASSPNVLITRSQRNSVILDACSSTGGEISCPYFHPNAYQEIPNAFKNMGVLSLNSFTSLNNSNGSTSNIIIQIYAWAENVVLSVPTTATHQHFDSHSDEYSTNIRITKAPNAIRSATGFFKKVIPKIGEYALATQSLISSVSGVAMLLGFSRPIILEKQLFVKNTLYGNVANCDAAECVHKLTLDSKQEITIDPRTVGLEPIDELQMSNVISRQSFLSSFDWSASSSQGQLLWSTRVTPIQVALEDIAPGCTRFTSTMLSYVSQMFSWWTGDIEYSFSVVASSYHKGRLLIVYDPSPPVSTSVPSSNAVYSRIIDISEVKDFVVRVAYSQSSPYMKVKTNSSCASAIWPINNGRTFGGTMIPSSVSNDNIGSNGTLSVFVLNPLLNPSASDTGNPTVIVMSRALENFKFAGLRNLNESNVGTVLPNVPISLVSHSLESPEPVISTTTVSTSADVDKYPLVWFGETFDSLRSILKRYNYYMSYYPVSSFDWDTPPVASTSASMWTVTRSNIPQYVGYDVNGFAGTTDKRFPGRLTTLGYIMPMYVGMRGGIRYKYASNVIGNSGLNSVLTVARAPDAVETFESLLVPVDVGTTTNPKLRNAAMPQISSGATLTFNAIQPVSELEIPYYSSSRFSYIRGTVAVEGETFDPTINPASSRYVSGIDCHTITSSFPSTGLLTTRNLTVDSYVSVGEDFQLFWLLSAPPTYGVFFGTS